jgi:hypothetical protein
VVADYKGTIIKKGMPLNTALISYLVVILSQVSMLLSKSKENKQLSKEAFAELN